MKSGLTRPWKRLLAGGALLVLVLGVALLTSPELIRGHLVQAFKLASGAMQPSLLVGDHILVDKTVAAEELQREDIVAFRYPPEPSKVFIKRVIGLPGERLEIRNKRVTVDGRELTENYAVHTDDRTVTERDQHGPIVVPERSLFVMGDNRDRSLDSRFWGFVGYDQVLGRAKRIYWSWDRESSAVRWNRIGRRVE